MDRIREDLKAAMKAQDKIRTGTIRMLLSDIKKKQIDTGAGAAAVPDDKELIQAVRSAVKSRQDSVIAYRSGGRDDLVEKEEREIAILQAYLPAELSPQELESIAREAITETGATSPRDMGMVMKTVMARAGGRADGKTVSTIVKQLLS